MCRLKMSKASKFGGKLLDEGRNLTEVMEDGVITGGPDTTTEVQGGAKATQFATKFGAREPMDDLMNLRQQLNVDGKGQTPFGEMYYDDSIGRWIQRKEEAVEAANFDAWFNQNFNKNNLADRSWAQEINPDFYQRRAMEMMEQTKEIFDLKMLEMYGPRNEKDVYKLYLLNRGLVKLPEDWDRIGKSTTASAPREADRQRFKSQLIRFPKIPSSATRSANAATSPMGDPNAGSVAFGQSVYDTGRFSMPLQKDGAEQTTGSNMLGFLGRVQ